MSWTDQEIQQVWEKGRIEDGRIPDKVRKDNCGAWMERGRHGDRESIFGWEIDHIIPVADGGTNDIDNLRPLQWENNLARENDPKAPCAVTCLGEYNTHLRRNS